jgi:hypothetical protein
MHSITEGNEPEQSRPGFPCLVEFDEVGRTAQQIGRVAVPRITDPVRPLSPVDVEVASLSDIRLKVVEFPFKKQKREMGSRICRFMTSGTDAYDRTGLHRMGELASVLYGLLIGDYPEDELSPLG